MRSLLIAARPPDVFAAINDPVRMARWWGPDGFTNTFHAFEFREGGTWTLTMHGPDGKPYPNECRFVRIEPDACVVIEHLGGHHFFLTLRLEPNAQGTLIRWQQTFDSSAHYEPIASFVAEANQQNLLRLDAEVRRSPGMAHS